MKVHELKIKYEYLVDIVLGNKTFELRKNDRNYQVGDLIRFFGIIDPKNDFVLMKNDMYVNNDAFYLITYVLKDVPEYGLDKDYCILGIKKFEVK